MQFVENSVFGVRVALLRLRSTHAHCTYTLLPMIHVGEQAFYDEVRRELQQQHHILYEGVAHGIGERMSRNFAMVAGSPRIKLATQRETLKGAAPKAEWIHIDMPGEVFARHWRKLPIWLRMAMGPLSWGLFLYLRWFGDRVQLGKVMPFADLRSRDEVNDERGKPDFMRILVNERDQHILAELDRVHERIRDKEGSAAILFGATHMRAIARHLTDRYGYQVQESRWLTVFGWDTPGWARSHGGRPEDRMFDDNNVGMPEPARERDAVQRAFSRSTARRRPELWGRLKRFGYGRVLSIIAIRVLAMLSVYMGLSD